MPRRKNATYNPRKAQLLFCESPLNGPTHHYGSPLPAAWNPRHAPAKPIGHSTSCLWVSPQFDKAELHSLSCRSRCHLANKTVRIQHQNREASHSWLRVMGMRRKSTVQKYPPLAFHSSIGTGNPSASLWDFRPISWNRKQVASSTGPEPSGPLTEKNQGISRTWDHPTSEFHTMKSNYIFSSLDTQTTEHNPLLTCQNTRSGPSLREVLEGRSTPCSKQQAMLCQDFERFNVSGNTSESLTSMRVLVEDSPEHEYGVRITWRRRQKLMKYLKERGKLKSCEILVKP